MTLADLAPGDTATVTAMADDAPVRLFEMGLLPGTEVTLVRRAPLGDPLDLRVRGFHLSVRASEARCVAVERSGPNA